MDKEKLLNSAKEIIAEVSPEEIESIGIETEQDINGSKRVNIALNYSEPEIFATPVSLLTPSEIIERICIESN